MSHLLEALQQVHDGGKSLEDAVTAYEEEMIPRGREEVKCSLENGRMLHDWEKVKESPVFKDGFRPMKGHDGYETNSKNGLIKDQIEGKSQATEVGAH